MAGVAKTMMQNICQATNCNSWTAGTYVLMISVFNIIGRIFWPNVRFIGRKTTISYSFQNLFVFIYPIYCKSNECGSCCYQLYIILCRINDYLCMEGLTIPGYLADILAISMVYSRTTSHCITVGVGKLQLPS